MLSVFKEFFVFNRVDEKYVKRSAVDTFFSVIFLVLLFLTIGYFSAVFILQRVSTTTSTFPSTTPYFRDYCTNSAIVNFFCKRIYSPFCPERHCTDPIDIQLHFRSLTGRNIMGFVIIEYQDICYENNYTYLNDQLRNFTRNESRISGTFRNMSSIYVNVTVCPWNSLYVIGDFTRVTFEDLGTSSVLVPEINWTLDAFAQGYVVEFTITQELNKVVETPPVTLTNYSSHALYLREEFSRQNSNRMNTLRLNYPQFWRQRVIQYPNDILDILIYIGGLAVSIYGTLISLNEIIHVIVEKLCKKNTDNDQDFLLDDPTNN